MEPRCAICGACFCVPSDDTLLSFINPSSPYKPITDDEVLWLRHFRLWGLRTEPEPVEADPFQAPGEAQEIYFLSGRGRIHRSQLEFLRGDVEGMPFGETCSTVRGQGKDEVLAIPLHGFPRESTYTMPSTSRSNTPLARLQFVHLECYDGVLPSVISYVLSKDHRRKQLRTESLTPRFGIMYQAVMQSYASVKKHKCSAEESHSRLWQDNPLAEEQLKRDANNSRVFERTYARCMLY